MTRHSITLLVILGFFTATGASADDRPNILLLVAEDMSPRVRAFGDEVAVTPNIDRLARQGIRYPNTFTTAGVCAPSRAALLTGMHQIAMGGQHMRASSYGRDNPEAGVDGYEAVPPPYVKAFAELLRAAGYYTISDGKLDYQIGGPMTGGPFTIWDDYGVFADWKDRPKDRPFYAQVNFGVTHESGLFPAGFTLNPTRAIMGAMRWFRYGSSTQGVVTPEAVRVPAYYPDTDIVRRTIARQYWNIEIMDKEIGAVLSYLEREGLADSTIVIWTTDHGDGLPRAKRTLYDSGLKVPMVIRWPERFEPADAQPGTIDNRLVSFIDLSSTILSLAGVEPPLWMHGRVFAGDQRAPERRYVYASRDRIDSIRDRARAVRDNRFKYIRNYHPDTPGAQKLAFRDNLEMMGELWELHESSKLEGATALWFEATRPREELYDTVEDPDEVKNLATDPAYAATLARMRGASDEWLTHVEDWSEAPEAEMVQRFWPNWQQPTTAAPTIKSENSRVTIECPTDGASIGYRINGAGAVSDWNLYTGPFKAKAGAKITAKAIRYGWAESEVTERRVR